MKTLVIIVSYNFERWIKPCLESLLQSKERVSVIVIDNHSQDHTVERIQKEYPDVHLIANQENWGFGKANNLGFHIALQEDYDYVFLLNQDAWIEPNTIGSMIEVSHKHPEFGILSPVHLTGDKQHIDSGFPIQELPNMGTNEVCEIPFVNAAMWLIPCNVLKRIGGFSPLFYHYGEDVDWVNRLHYHGYKVGYCLTFGCHDREKRVVTKAMEYRGKSVYLHTVFANYNQSLYSAFIATIGGSLQ